MTRKVSIAPSDYQQWRNIQLAPATVLYGSNDYFVQRAQQRLRAQFREQNPDAEISHISARDYRRGEIAVLSSPSLFGSAKIIEVSQLAQMSEDFLQDALAYLENPDGSTVLIAHHTGGNRGKKLLDLFRSSRKFNFVECHELKRDQDKLNFVLDELREHDRKIEPRAAQVLVAAAGKDTSELASACRQLAEDISGTITEDAVNRYYGGRIEVTAFRVSDEAVRGNSKAALKLLRNAIDTGVEPIPLMGALALRIRHIARVHGSSGSARSLASQLKLAPWQVEQAQRDSRRFSQDDLATILKTLADADAQLKGEAQDPLYAVEKAVLTISTASG